MSRPIRLVLAALSTAALALSFAIAGALPAQAATPTRIMPLGDSITGGPGCWRAMLWDRLQRTGFTNIDFVGTLPGGGCNLAGWDGDNEGHGGFQATGIANQNLLPGWLSTTSPDVVLMHLGTNDVWNNVPAATILAAYGKLVDQMRAANPSMKILVAQIIPMTPSGCTWCPAGVSALNGAIPAWAAGKSTAQSPIAVVDQFSGFDTAVDTTDGVHPDDSGFQKMSDRWYPALTPLLGSVPADTTPPTVPSGLRATVNCSMAVTLTWTASTDNVAVTGYDVYRSVNNAPFTARGTTTATTFSDTLTGLTQYQVRARDAAGNTSAFTAPITAPIPACPPPDTQPPTTPGTPTASATTATSTTLSWTASTDNISVTAYDVLRSLNNAAFTAVGTTATTTFTNTGLSPGSTYRYQVRARDAAGNTSAFSPTVTVQTPSGGACTATLVLQSAWSNGYVMQPNAVTNTGSTTLLGWTVTFTLPAGHTIAGFWNVNLTVNGQTVTARGISGQNGILGPGATVTWGFQATRPSGNTAVPSGATCTSP